MVPAFFGRGLPLMSSSTPNYPVSANGPTGPRVPSSGSSSGISSIAMATQSISRQPSSAFSSGVHTLEKTPPSIAVSLSRGEHRFQTPGLRSITEYKKNTRDNENRECYYITVYYTNSIEGFHNYVE